ncbi:VOC family protein [Actinoplanes sp. NPDC051411]|uniref:VOC family protein n=1 Tax=Actinoplanes sp. NPDC051411 TaxID=3155522 RepID=UPI003417586E
MFTEAFPIVTVPSIATACEFYVGLLGFRLTYAYPPEGDPDFVVVRLGASELGLGLDPLAAPADALELCVYADDCDRAVATLRSAGVLVVEEPSDQAWGERMARVLDPAGNRVMIVSRDEKN